MANPLIEMRNRLKDRVGIYGTGWHPESVMGLLLPFVLVGILALLGWLLVQMLHSV